MIVVGHRGASGYRPEHTLASYELAARMGADFVEPDLVSTVDGALVARHEPEIGGTTDVASRPEFEARRCTKSIDDVEVSGWFAEDFTLDELRMLRAVERIPDVRPSNTRFDGEWGIPTLEEIVALCVRLSEELGRPVGVFPETKHPSYFAGLGLELEPGLVAALDGCGVPVVLQCFETSNLIDPGRSLGVETVQLIGAVGGPADMPDLTFEEMAGDLGTIASYADWVGPAKSYVDAAFVASAHSAGLKVMPYTLRREAQFLGDFPDLVAELRWMNEIGVDGVFTDNPDLAVAAIA